jgi:uncharacterized protein
VRHRAQIAGFAIEATLVRPVVFLQSMEDKRLLPILIGTYEAERLLAATQPQLALRPQPEHLTIAAIDALGGEIESALIAEEREGAFLAVISVSSASGTLELDARPSDALAIALASGAPIFIQEGLLDAFGYLFEGSPVSDEQLEVDRFRRFLDTVSPDEFRMDDDASPSR